MHTNPLPNEIIRWEGYASWAQFSWLYLFTLMAGFRGMLGFRLGIIGWEGWIVGAIALLVCVALLRRWGRYIVTSQRLIIENGFTGHTIQEIPVGTISEVDLKQGPVAEFFQIGTLAIRSTKDDQVLSFRGVKNPDVLKTRIEAMMGTSSHSS